MKKIEEMSKVEVYNYFEILLQNLKDNIPKIAIVTIFIRDKGWDVPAIVDKPMVLKCFEQIVDERLLPEIFLFGAVSAFSGAAKLNKDEQKKLIERKTIPAVSTLVEDDGKVIEKPASKATPKDWNRAIENGKLKSVEEVQKTVDAERAQAKLSIVKTDSTQEPVASFGAPFVDADGILHAGRHRLTCQQVGAFYRKQLDIQKAKKKVG